MDQVLLRYISNNGQIAPFPPGFTVREDASNAPALYLDGAFVLVWLNSYQIRFNNSPIIRVQNQRQQSLFGSSEVEKGHGDQHHVDLVDTVHVLQAEDVVVVD